MGISMIAKLDRSMYSALFVAIVVVGSIRMMYLPVASLLYDDVVHALRDRPAAAAAAPPLVVGKVLPAPFAADAVEGVVLAVLPKGGELLL